MIYPANFEQKTGFDRIRAMIVEECLCRLGVKHAEAMSFSSSFEYITNRLEQTDEFVKVCRGQDEFPVAFYFDITSCLNKIRIPGTYIETTELFDLKRSLDTIADILRFFRNRQELFPVLFRLSKNVTVHKFVTDKTDAILNKQGKIRDSASPELQAIRSELFQKQETVGRRLASVLKQAQSEGWVDPDAGLTMRNGRIVIPVPSSNKRKLHGFIHDESATGKTSFIEPAEIFEINNDIRELEYSEQREIIKILIIFTDTVRPYLDDLMKAYEFLGIIDFIRAKAILAMRLNSVKPRILESQVIRWKNAVHPLLYLSHKKENKKVVPLEIELNENQRIIVISGPNAGGKSVCLKTVGLLQYMLQCGLLIPVDENTEAGIFQHIFIDIGDEQSIENDLSTYSSHLLNMKSFLKFADNHSLVLIDEFGAGTEPALGGAIAEAILGELNKAGTYGVITTHYTNLKQFAAHEDGIVNGAMMFDNNRLQPLFRLETGKPGSSFAFEIARSIGLPESILKLAAEKAGNEQIRFDKLLRQASRDKRYWETKRDKIHDTEKRLDELVAKLSEELKKSEKERKSIIHKANDQANELLAGVNKKIENIIQEIRNSQAEKEKTRQLRKELEDFREEVKTEFRKEEESADQRTLELARQEKQIRRQIPGKQSKPVSDEKLKENMEATLRIGDKVKLKGENTAGEIIEMNEKNLLVAFGNLITSISPDKTERISSEEYSRLTKGRQSSSLGVSLYNKRMNFKIAIDVRGMRVEELIPAITDYIDDAIMLDVNEVKILHGTGNGVLRQVVREYLRTVELVKSFHDEHVEFGGAGITVVRFR
ncbi:MAG: Smr/MutS family protein [Bacteroidia bacterium]|nr:Smr/MutS family protein [Bacteroidia bacterium]